MATDPALALNKRAFEIDKINPLDNIANMRAIQAVYLGGRKFE